MGHYNNVANSLYTFSSTPFLHDENFAGRCVSRAAFYYEILLCNGINFSVIKN